MKMHKIQPKPINEHPWYLKPFFWNQKRKYGVILDSALIWARVPKLFLGVAFLYGMVDRRSSLLSPEIRTIVTVRVSQINLCSFCVDINSATLLKRNVPHTKVIEIENWRQSTLFDDKEKVALEYAETVTLSDLTVTENMMVRLHNSFTEDQIVELTAVIAFQNMSSKFNSALAVPAQGFCSTQLSRNLDKSKVVLSNLDES